MAVGLLRNLALSGVLLAGLAASAAPALAAAPEKPKLQLGVGG